MLTTVPPDLFYAHRVPATLPALASRVAAESDRVLVIRAASGDEHAFTEIVRRHTSLLRATATRILGNSGEVDDVVQDTFIVAWTNMDTVIDGDTIRGWLVTTVRRRCFDRLRSVAGQRRIDLDQDFPESLERGPAAVFERSSLISEARALLERMPALQRRCWELRQLQQRSYDEISEELGVAATVVRGQLARGRQLMQAGLAHWR